MQYRGFDWALNALKAGYRVSRAGWNGKGMWLQIVDGVEMHMPIRPDGAPVLADNALFDETFASTSERVRYPAHIVMKTATNEIVPWLASVTDLMAEDWTLEGRTL